MCCCDQPNVNGQPGYKWQPNDPPRVRPVDPPDLKENETCLYDEPGRCGGMDSHSFHYRLVRGGGHSATLVVQHGGGQERMRVSSTETLLQALAAMDSNARYWIFNAIYHAHSDGERAAADRCNTTWTKAAAEKRIKTRKNSHRGTVKVWIEQAQAIA